MDWFLFALIPPFLWALGIHIDKYIVSKLFKGNVGVAVVYSCLIGLAVLPVAIYFQPNVFAINPVTALILILNGFLYISYLFPYLAALKEEEASNIQPFFQTIPVFGAILAFFILKETLSINQLVASALVIIGAIGFSIKINNKGFRIKKKTLALILSAAFIISLNAVVFKLFALELDYWTTIFWQEFGFALLGILLLLFKKNYRTVFRDSFKRNSFFVLGLNLFNEVINIVAVLVFNFVMLLAPLALVWVINGFNPVFALLIGIFVTVFFPKVAKEDISRATLLKKLFFLLIMLIGGFLLNSTGAFA